MDVKQIGPFTYELAPSGDMRVPGIVYAGPGMLDDPQQITVVKPESPG